MHWAAIQISFTGTGVPFVFKKCFSSPKISEVSSVIVEIVTTGISKKAVNGNYY